MQNVEFKAELRDLELGRTIARRLGGKHVGQLWQVDTYYRLADGRLKRRETEGAPAEYILYERTNSARARLSKFTIYSENEAFAQFGAITMEPWVVVKKARDVYMLGGVRVHLDQVERLGTFLEFEALVSPAQNMGRCYRIVEQLRRDFAAVLGEPVPVSYSDLMALEPQYPPAAGPPG